MNIWILNHYADTPDRQATRTYDLAKALVEKGHQVRVFASSFNHYSLKEERLQPGEGWKAQDCNGVRFIWLKTPAYTRNDWRRVRNMFSYSWRAFWCGSQLAEQPEVIIGVSVHPLAALMAWLLSRFKRSRFFFEVTDLWPQALIDLGMLSEKSPLAWGLWVLEKFLYRRAEKIITLWPHVHLYTTALGIPPDKVIWIPHGVELSRYEELKPYDGLASKTFTIMFLGHHGVHNDLDVILDAAKLLQDCGGTRVRFVFVGDGTDKPRLVQRSKDMKLGNVEFRDVVPKQEIYKMMGEADAFISCWKDISTYRYGISLNKLCDYFAAGRPVLFAINAGYNPVEEAKAGIALPPQNPKALVEGIRKLIAMKPEERIKMGENGFRYVRSHHDIRVLAQKLESSLFQAKLT